MQHAVAVLIITPICNRRVTNCCIFSNIFFSVYKMTSESGHATAPSCKRCKRCNLVNAVKCTKCDSAFHESCAKLFVNQKVINKASFWCCDGISSGKPAECEAFWDAIDTDEAVEKCTEPRLFRYILKQKDDMISELRGKIMLLEKHIILPEKNHELKPRVVTYSQNLQKMNASNTKKKTDIPNIPKTTVAQTAV